MTDDIVAWLRGVLAGDEAAARDEMLLSKRAQVRPEVWHWMLADIEAKRAILDEIPGEIQAMWNEIAYQDGTEDAGSTPAAAARLVRLLATAYHDRPGYREEWAPARKSN